MPAQQPFSLLSDELPEELQERVDIIRHKLKFTEAKPTVLCIEQLEPMKVSGSQIPELTGIAGGIPALLPSSEIAWSDITENDPDIFILLLTGLSVQQAMGSISTLLQQPGFTNLKAVKNNRIYIANAGRYFDNTDVYMADALEILAEIINPKQFNFGYDGEGWVKFSL
jgi:iron complex transport system substrate-binding protein